MPPYADNLYSMEESDDESFSDALSPTDGYFGPSQVPANVMVPDPSIDYGPPEAKTLLPPPESQNSLEPGTGRSSRLAYRDSRLPPTSPSHSYASHQSGSNYGAPPSQYTSLSPMPAHQRDGSMTEHNSMMYHPPPAYSESPPLSTTSFPSVSSPSSTIGLTATSPTWASPSNRDVYSTVPETHLERGFLLPREPQSMGGPTDDLGERSPLVPASRSKFRFLPRRRKVKGLLFAALVLTLVGTTFPILLRCKQWGRRSDAPFDQHTQETYCPDATPKGEQAVYEFSARSGLKIVQKQHRIVSRVPSSRQNIVTTQGEIRMRTAPTDSKHGTTPYITVDIGSSLNLDVSLKWSHTSQTLELSTPENHDDPRQNPECLYAMITAWIPAGSEFSDINLSSVSLNLALADIQTNVTGSSEFNSVTGNIWLPTQLVECPQDSYNVTNPPLSSKPPAIGDFAPLSNFSSRRVVVETISGGITGSYPLLDELLISSESGDVTVSVVPQAASKSSPAPADLEIQTASGTIRVDLPIDALLNSGNQLPSRDYITRVHSTSGDISGTYYLGSESSFKTTSSSIDIKILPILPLGGEKKTTKNVFETHTVSGNTNVVVLEPTFFFYLSLKDKQPPAAIYQPAHDNDPYLITPPTVSTSNSASEAILDTTKSSLRSIRSAHSSNTGEVQVTYPRAWQGSVHAKTVSGRIGVSGDGFRTIKSRDGWSFHEVLKRKDVSSSKEGCFVEMSNISGALIFGV